MTTDKLHRFILDASHVRGSWVKLGAAWRELQGRAEYPPAIKQLLGQALAAVSLLSTTIKHEGAMILQIRGDGPVHLLVVQINNDGDIRGLVRWTQEPDIQAHLPQIFGKGHFAITLESDNEHERYQGIVALEGNNLAQALEAYFQQSEQLPTQIHLTNDDDLAVGMLIQRLPGESDSEDWERATALMSTLRDQELLDLDAEAVVYRLFHEEQPRLFPADAIQFKCSCGQDRVEQMLISLGRQEAEQIIAEQGEVTVTCEFCNAVYALDKVDVERLFVANSFVANDTLH